VLAVDDNALLYNIVLQLRGNDTDRITICGGVDDLHLLPSFRRSCLT